MTAILAILFAATTYVKLDYLPDTARPHPARREPQAVTVCIDPGHGGAADGAHSHSGRLEKDVNLLLANDIRGALTNAGFRVVMTREDDRDVDLFERPAVAIVNGADLFISVHHNAPPPGQDPLKTRYRAVYSWNPLGARLSACIARAWKARDLHANFAVTRNPHVPSVLLEADFITHPDGERAAWDAEARRILALGVVRGILDWLAGP